jgi:hypothetical protein
MSRQPVFYQNHPEEPVDFLLCVQLQLDRQSAVPPCRVEEPLHVILCLRAPDCQRAVQSTPLEEPVGVAHC